ncbi:hypothetical protein CK203_045112 [Vitis vinifera]|uniref:Uncharacterized protein n=1 Tax=Vitis vinifera TaxID=29760 RepID=A0A438HD39_VITVI|nr:hypothetical protein CK203_045112 [Vitis vinifera]
MTIFPHFLRHLRLLHFSTARLRLGHNLGMGFSALNPLQPDVATEEEKEKKKNEVGARGVLGDRVVPCVPKRCLREEALPVFSTDISTITDILIFGCNTIGSISLVDIDASNEWLVGNIGEKGTTIHTEDDLVFEDNGLTWGVVASATSVGYANISTRLQARLNTSLKGDLVVATSQPDLEKKESNLKTLKIMIMRWKTTK